MGVQDRQVACILIGVPVDDSEFALQDEAHTRTHVGTHTILAHTILAHTMLAHTMMAHTLLTHALYILTHTGA